MIPAEYLIRNCSHEKEGGKLKKGGACGQCSVQGQIQSPSKAAQRHFQPIEPLRERIEACKGFTARYLVNNQLEWRGRHVHDTVRNHTYNRPYFNSSLLFFDRSLLQNKNQISSRNKHGLGLATDTTNDYKDGRQTTPLRESSYAKKYLSKTSVVFNNVRGSAPLVYDSGHDKNSSNMPSNLNLPTN